MALSTLPQDADALLKPNKTARILDVTESTLAKWRCTGQNNLPFIKIGRVIRYRVSDINAYLAKHTINGGAA